MLTMDITKPDVALSIPEVNTWHLISILYKTFKCVHIEDCGSTKVCIKVRNFKTVGNDLEEVTYNTVIQLWDKIPKEAQKVIITMTGWEIK